MRNNAAISHAAIDEIGMHPTFDARIEMLEKDAEMNTKERMGGCGRT